MKKYFFIATLATLTVAAAVAPAWAADTAADAAQVKLQSASASTMVQSIARAGGIELKSVELKHTAHLVTATIVNSKQNASASSEREKKATSIASEIQKKMAGKPEFAGVAAIHIDYISRLGTDDKTIQMFDFFRTPANVFVLHKT
jgi:hypothetical protein